MLAIICDGLLMNNAVCSVILLGQILIFVGSILLAIGFLLEEIFFLSNAGKLFYSII